MFLMHAMCKILTSFSCKLFQPSVLDCKALLPPQTRALEEIHLGVRLFEILNCSYLLFALLFSDFTRSNAPFEIMGILSNKGRKKGCTVQGIRILSSLMLVLSVYELTFSIRKKIPVSHSSRCKVRYSPYSPSTSPTPLPLQHLFFPNTNNGPLTW